MTGNRGVTMVELMVVLALLGLMAAVVGLAWRPNLAKETRRSDPVAVARQRAIESGAAVHVQVNVDGKIVSIAALPDGSVISDAELPIDPLTGRGRSTTP